MKIAFFTDTYEPQVNGVVTSINSFSEELKQRGNEVHIFCPQSFELKETEFVHTAPSVKFYPYPEYRVGLPQKKIYDLIKKFLKVLRSRPLQKKLSTGGLETAKEFSMEKCAAKLENLYQNAIPSKMFSIIVPTYFEEKYIKKTLGAVRSQSYRNFEIILVDSNSKDMTRAIAKKFADKVINIKKRGVGLARNIGAKSAKGDLLLFLDADTILEKDFLKKVSKAFDDKNVVATSGYIYTKGSLLDRIIFSGTSEISWLTTLIGRPLFYGMCMAVRKNAFKKVHGFDETHETAEDINFSERLGKIGKCVLIRKARAFTYPRRTKKMGAFYSVFYHVTNFLRYKFFGEGRRGYPVAR